MRGRTPLAARLIAALLLVLSPGLARAEVLRLGTQLLPPYQMYENGEMTGVAVERVKCALEDLGLPFEFHMMNWSRAQLKTQRGDLEGFFAGSQNADRDRYAIISAPVISEDLAWYMPQSSSLDPNAPINRLRARYSAKFATSKWLNLKRDGYNVVKKPQDAEVLLTMLLRGDIDVALEYELIFEHYMRERGLPLDHFRKVPLRRQDLNVLFSKDFLAENPLFLERFNTSLRACVGRDQ